MLNEFHFTLLKELKSWQKILYWKHEYKYPYGIADGLYVVKTTLDSGIKFFLEMDDGNNEFDKISRYEAYCNSRKWESEPWADPLGKGVKTFPLVVIATPRPEKLRKESKVKLIVLERERLLEGDILKKTKGVQHA